MSWKRISMIGGNIDKKKMAVLMVSVLLVSSLAMILINTTDDDSSADTGYKHDVIYHPNNGVNFDVKVTYDGIISTEYNPLYWANSFQDNTGEPVTSNWSAPVGTYSYSSAGPKTLSKVFAGWSEVQSPTSVAQLHNPGDVIPSSITELWAYWVFPDMIRLSNGSYYDTVYVRSSGSSVTYHTQATGGSSYTISSYVSGDAIAGVSTMYTRQFVLGTAFNPTSATLVSGSYRSTSNIEFHIGGQVKMSGDVIIDNVKLTTTAPNGNHGYGNGYGLYASGHMLILGTGITNVNPIPYSSSSRTYTAPQIYGGNASGTLTAAAVTGKKIVSGYYDEEGAHPGDKDDIYGLTVNLGTYVIIHSGIYDNVFGGGNATIGSTSAPLSTYLVFKNGTVLDTVCGGNQSQGSQYIYGASGKSSVSAADNNAKQGGTFVYVLGGNFPGDKWSSVQAGTYVDYNLQTDLNEAVALIGGSARSHVVGSSHVFLSGNASAWDAQGGGRSGEYSTITFGYVEATGSATVRHIMCGAVTDGTSTDKTCVYGTKVILSDDARVATLCGAGYDTWASPTGSGMANGRTIDVLVDGGNVGFVYGGGFRGTVGSTSHNVEINVNILGGTVEYDVFGGGRGGLEKALLDVNGEPTVSDFWSASAWKNPTGYSKTYGNIEVNIGDATVKGSVYAAGESIASLTYYKGVMGAGTSHGAFNSPIERVAEVIGTSKVTVSGEAEIYGSVYGAGKGIALDSGSNVDAKYRDYEGNVVTDYYYSKTLLYGMNAGGEGIFYFNDWFVGTNDTITYSTSGVDNYAMVTGQSSVVIEGGDVYGSVYGGGALGITTGNSQAEIKGGTIHGNVFGGGLGTLGKESVTGNTTLTIRGGTILGSAYGGAENGWITGTTTLYVYGGYVAQNAFAGGLGGLTFTSVKSKRYVYVDGGEIGGSLYGGSSLGNDMSATPGLADVQIYILSGTIGASVFGGGFKGTTDGDSEIYVGYDIDYTSPYTGVAEKNITIRQSIYGGADVGTLGDGEEPFDPTRIIFIGDTMVRLSDGENVNLNFSGSIFGSGNSCIITGTATVSVLDFHGDMESIHRADDVTVQRSTLNLEGRDGLDGTNMKYSFYLIDHLKLMEGSGIYLYAPMMNVEKYSSQNADGRSTASSSPSNRVVICDGTLFTVQSKVGSVYTYNPVEGYTILSLLNTETYYGAYAMASVDSTGGFVIERSGSYRVADSLFSADCRCWFLSGTTQQNLSVVLDEYGHAASTTQMIRASNTTGLRYTSGYFVPSAANYHLTDDISGKGEGYFKVNIGATAAAANVTFNGGAGIPLHDNMDTTTCLDDAFKDYVEHGGVYDMDLLANIGFTVDGTTVGVNSYIGYVMFYFQEITLSSYKDSEGHDVPLYIIQNRCEVKVDIYTSGSALDGSGNPNVPTPIDLTVTASEKTGGYTSIIIPQGLVGYDVTVEGADFSGVTENIPMKVSTTSNDANSNGWNGGLTSITFTPGETKIYPIALGNTHGAFSATVRFSVDSFSGTADQHYQFTMKVVKGTAEKTFIVNIKVVLAMPVTVTFVDPNFTPKGYPFPFGSTISEALCPLTESNFIGWYIDPDYSNPFNFNTVLITDITLYARYAYKVTFNNMNGTTSEVLVGSVGSTISKPNPDPSWVGFTFIGWYADRNYENEWIFSDDPLSREATLINGDVEIFAKWQGNPVKVKFQYDENYGTGNPESLVFLYDGLDLYTASVIIGDVFGNGYTENPSTHEMEVTHPDFISDAVTLVKSKMTDPDLYVRWELQWSDELIFCAYNDTEVPTNITNYLHNETGVYYIYLTAHFSDTAIYVDLVNSDTKVENVIIEAPIQHLLFPEGGYYTFYANNATCTNGYRLTGWSTGTTFVEISNQWQILQTDIDNGAHLTLYATWSPIEYSVTVVKPYGGDVKVYDMDDNLLGTTVGGNFTMDARYGEKYKLTYAEDGSYVFNNWHINGEGTTTPIDNIETVFTVNGNSAVYAQLIGLRDVAILLHMNGEYPLDEYSLYLYEGSSPYTKLDLNGSQYDTVSGQLYAKYTAMSKVGTFSVAVRGTSQTYFVGTVTVTPTGAVQIVSVFSVDYSGLYGKEYLDGSLPEYIGSDGFVEFSIKEHYELKNHPVTDEKEILVEQYDGTLDNQYTSDRNFKYVPGPIGGLEISGLIDTCIYDVTYTTAGETGTFQFVFPSGTVDSPYVLKDNEYLTYVNLPTSVLDSSGNEIRPIDVDSDSIYMLVGWYYGNTTTSEQVSGTSVQVTDAMSLYAIIMHKDAVNYTVKVYLKERGTSNYTEYPTVFEDSVLENENYKAFQVSSVEAFTGYNFSYAMIGDDVVDYTSVKAVKGAVVKIYCDLASREQKVNFSTTVSSTFPVPAGWALDGDRKGMTKTVEYGESVQLPVINVVGNTQSWKINGVTSEVSQYTYLPLTLTSGTYTLDSVNITSVFTKNYYQLTLDAVHGRINGEQSISLSVEYGTLLSTILGTYVASDEGYTLGALKWLRSGAPINPDATYMPDEDVLLTPNWIANTYHVAFNGNGGTGSMGTIDATYGTTVITMPSSTFTYVGHTFKEWNTAADGSGIVYTAGSTYNNMTSVNDATITLFAIWTTDTHTLTINYVGYPTPQYKATLEYGEDYSVATPVVDHYQFNTATVSGTMGTENITVTVTYTPKDYNIEYILGGGTVTPANPVVYNIESADILLNEPTLTGYHFLGWTGTGLDGTTKPVTIATGSYGDRTYTAVWEIDTFTITWKNYDGTVLDTDTVDYNVLPAYTGATPTKPSTTEYYYTFTVWDPAIVVATDDAIYTAQYSTTPQTYHVYYVVNGSQVHDDPFQFGATTTTWTYEVPLGYTFSGWDTTVPAEMPDHNITLTGTTDYDLYTVTFVTNGGTIINGEIAAYTYGTATPLPGADDITKEPDGYSYAFAGWYDNPSFTGDVFTAIPADATGNKTFYAKWDATIRQFTITFNTNGGSAIDPITQDYDTAITPPANPTKEGYNFVEWSPAIPATMPVDGLTVNAVWSAKSYKITFLRTNNPSDVYHEQYYDFGDTVSAPVDPSRSDGYLFAGWSAIVPTTMPAGDMTLTGLWYRYAPYAGVYDRSSHAITYDADMGVTMTFSLTDGGTYVAENPTFTDAGTYTVYFKVTTVGKNVSGSSTVTIEKKELTLEWGDTLEFEYDASPHAPTLTVTGVIEGDECTVTTNTNVNAGSHTAVASEPSNANYKLPVAHSIEYEITPYEIGLIWVGALFKYDGASHVPTAIVFDPNNGPLLVNESCSANVIGSQINAGTYTATVASLTNTNFKTPATGTTCQFTIQKINYNMTSVKFNDGSFVYDGTSHHLVITGALPTGIDGITPTVSYLGEATDVTIGLGVTITAVFETESLNYEVPVQRTAKMIITPKPLTITGVTANDKDYDGNINTTINTSAMVLNDVVPADADYVDIVVGVAQFNTGNAGSGKQVTFSNFGLSGTRASNYMLASQPASVTATINKIPLSITADDLTVEYGNTPAFTITPVGFIPGESVNNLQGILLFDCDYVIGSLPGTYDITPSGYTSSNYTISFYGGTLTVVKKSVPIIITANSKSISGDSGTVLTDSGFTFTPGIIIDGDELSAVVVGQQNGIGSSANHVTSFSVSRGGSDVTAGYSFSEPVDGILEVYLEYNISITDGSSITYDINVIDIEGLEGLKIRAGDPLDFNVKAKIAVKSIDVRVKMSGVELEDAFQRETATSGHVHIDSVTGDVNIIVTYEPLKNQLNIPLIIIMAILVLAVIAISIWAIKKHKEKKANAANNAPKQ